MKNKSNNIFIKLLFLFELIQITSQKSTLKANHISNNECDYESGVYSFNISATLNRTLSEKMLESYTFNTQSNNYYNQFINLNINYYFPEINESQNEKKKILIMLWKKLDILIM